MPLLGGVNVVDAGARSNFLTGGMRPDTFFDTRATGAPIWSTVVGFHAGDGLTMHGIAPSASGLTLHAAKPGRAMATHACRIHSDGPNGRGLGRRAGVYAMMMQAA